MTDPKPVPHDVLGDGRDSCAAWFAESLGADPFAHPAHVALKLLLSGGLDPKQAEVARVLIWFEGALPATQLVEDYRREETLSCCLVVGDTDTWCEVETEAPGEEEARTMLEVADLERQVDQVVRKLIIQAESKEKLFVRYCEAGIRLDELTMQRLNRGRVVAVFDKGEQRDDAEGRQVQAAENAVRSWNPGERRWQLMMLKWAVGLRGYPGRRSVM